jgi:butyryl-CoA dehydrogenase
MGSQFVSQRNLKFLLYDVFDTIALTEHAYYDAHRRQTFGMVLDATMKMARG